AGHHGPTGEFSGALRRLQDLAAQGGLADGQIVLLVVPAQLQEGGPEDLGVLLQLAAAQPRHPVEDVPLPAGGQHRGVVLPLVVRHLPDRLHPLLEQRRHLIVDAVQLVPVVLQFHCLSSSSIISSKVSAVTASTTGTARGTIQGSWRPWMVRRVFSMVFRSTVSCSRGMEAVGLKPTFTTRCIPVVMPPSTPPAWLVRVETVVPSVTKGSLCSLPRMPAAAKPSPKDTPRTAGMPKRAPASRFSTPSNMGSPTPAGR